MNVSVYRSESINVIMLLLAFSRRVIITVSTKAQIQLCSCFSWWNRAMSEIFSSLPGPVILLLLIRREVLAQSAQPAGVVDDDDWLQQEGRSSSGCQVPSLPLTLQRCKEIYLCYISWAQRNVLQMGSEWDVWFSPSGCKTFTSFRNLIFPTLLFNPTFIIFWPIECKHNTVVLFIWLEKCINQQKKRSVMYHDIL